MKIGVLGTGDVGRVLAAGFAQRGHEVMIGTRNPEQQNIRAGLRRLVMVHRPERLPRQHHLEKLSYLQ